MGSLLRGEEMTLCQLFLQAEAAYACVAELGEIGLVQFRDLNPDVNAFQRKFVNEVRRCDEMERKLRFLEKEIRKDGIPILDTGESPEAPAPREMIDLEGTFEKLENEMKEVNANAEALKKNFLELTELKHILRKTQTFFDEAELQFEQAASDPSIVEESAGLLAEESGRAGQATLRLGFVAGVIHRERLPAFERMLWRACRGNVFLKTAEIESPLEDPVTGTSVNKCVFIIFFQGDQLKTRVKKICEGFRASLYPCPETPAERREMALGVMTRIEDLNTVLQQTQDHRQRVLVAAAKNLKVWSLKVRKIKAIYHTLNMFNLDVTQKCLIGECWCAVADLDKIQLALRRGTERSGSSVPSILNRMETSQPPPTFHRNNKFTSIFQDVVDSYAVASYREVNPAIFTIISFPFLFSVMFGDAGHAVIMLLFALFMIIKEKQFLAQKNQDEIVAMFFGGRYIILLMGAFSIYSGLLYNDIFSKSINIFGSGWNLDTIDDKYVKEHELITLDAIPANSTYNSSWTRDPYPFGMDPMWQLSENKLTFLNSYKMKISVIFGITHMVFGVILSLFNLRFFKDPIGIVGEFIPEIIFIVFLFVYLVFLIMFKWILFDATESAKAPSLLIHFINMFMLKYYEEGDEDAPNGAAKFYAGQQGIQIFLLLVALACVPMLLCFRPLVTRKQHKGTLNRRPMRLRGDSHSDEEAHHHDDVQPLHQAAHPEEFDFGEAIVHQAIHTIEYCLGCISHTASYLRLWALSLAHAELSEVLWTMVMKIALQIEGYAGFIVVFAVFAPWAVLTVGILLLMEGLSAFLHTIRLHWIEFQSKFYKGEGYKFVPFSFKYLEDLEDILEST